MTIINNILIIFICIDCIGAVKQLEGYRSWLNKEALLKIWKAIITFHYQVDIISNQLEF